MIEAGLLQRHETVSHSSRLQEGQNKKSQKREGCLDCSIGVVSRLFFSKCTSSLYQECGLGSRSLRPWHSIRRTALMRSERLLSPAITARTPGPGQLSGNMRLCSQGGLREGMCVWICANPSPRMVNQLSSLHLVGDSVVPFSQSEGSRWPSFNTECL